MSLIISINLVGLHVLIDILPIGLLVRDLASENLLFGQAKISLKIFQFFFGGGGGCTYFL